MTDLQMEQAREAPRGVGAPLVDWLGTGLWWFVFSAWQLVRISICAVLVLGEPVMRAVLVPVAFLGFLVTMIFGFLIGDPRFPRWGMLALSVGALVLYWGYLGFMSLFMALPSHDCDR